MCYYTRVLEKNPDRIAFVPVQRASVCVFGPRLTGIRCMLLLDAEQYAMHDAWCALSFCVRSRMIIDQDFAGMTIFR